MFPSSIGGPSSRAGCTLSPWATGARGLRSIFEGLFRDALYEVPNRSRESEEEVAVFLHHHQGSAAVEVVVGKGNIETFMNNNNSSEGNLAASAE